MEVIKKLNDSLETKIEKEGAGAQIMFRMKTTYKEDGVVLEESLLNPQDFLRNYAQVLGQKQQYDQGVTSLSAQIKSKNWEKWPEQVEDLKKESGKLNEQIKAQYRANFQEVKKLIPEPTIKQIMGQYRVTNYE